ncbi:MAG: hypothetical protein K940chlam7_01004 [Chlamydiae bacterium]|nr:hypothetical protein [Chlamydiota bacterium]
MEKSKCFLRITLCASIALLMLSGCYKMPAAGEYSAIPATNNPDVCGDRGPPSWMPSAGF